MGVSTRAKADDPGKMRKSSSASKIISAMIKSKPAVAPKPLCLPKTSKLLAPKVATRLAPPKVAPKQSKAERPAVPPKPMRRKSQPFRQNSGTDVSKDRLALSPKRRSSGRIPKPAKTPGWSSPNDEAFRRPVASNNRRTSIYQKRIRMSLLDADFPAFSPSRTRRRSVYGAPPPNLSQSPPKPRPRRSMAPPTSLAPPILAPPATSRLPTPPPRMSATATRPPTPPQPHMGMSFQNPVVVIDPLVMDPVKPEVTKPQPKKRRPVCGVAALRRQSILPEVAPAPRIPCAPRDEVDDAKVPRYDESVLEKSVEIVDVDMNLMTPPKPEANSADYETAGFFTPAGKGVNLDNSFYETPAVKVKATPASRLPSSVTRRRHKTPRAGTGKPVSAIFEEPEVVPTYVAKNEDDVAIVEGEENSPVALVRDEVPNVEVASGGHERHHDSSKCVIS